MNLLNKSDERILNKLIDYNQLISVKNKVKTSVPYSSNGFSLEEELMKQKRKEHQNKLMKQKHVKMQNTNPFPSSNFSQEE